MAAQTRADGSPAAGVQAAVEDQKGWQDRKVAIIREKHCIGSNEDAVWQAPRCMVDRDERGLRPMPCPCGRDDAQRAVLFIPAGDVIGVPAGDSPHDGRHVLMLRKLKADAQARIPEQVALTAASSVSTVASGSPSALRPAKASHPRGGG